MTAEGNRSTGTNHLRGYVDAVEILDESVDVSPTLSVGHDEMPYDTPPTSPSYAASQDDKSQRYTVELFLSYKLYLHPLLVQVNHTSRLFAVHIASL